MSDELINNLRAIANGAGSTTEPWHVMAGQAADRLEEVSAENAKLHAYITSIVEGQLRAAKAKVAVLRSTAKRHGDTVGVEGFTKEIERIDRKLKVFTTGKGIAKP